MSGRNPLKKYFAYVNYGCNFSSKLRMAIIIAFSNHIILSKVPGYIGKILIGVSNRLSHSVTILVNGLLYNLVDYHSFYICSSYAEEWAWDYLPVQEGDLFIDIGAHLGKYTLPIAYAVGKKGSVIAVEASRTNYNCLKNNIKLNNLHNITVFNVAAWSNDEKLEFYPGELSGGGSIKKKTGEKHIEISGRSMDSLLEELNREAPVNWIKIDVEGAELGVLKGLAKTLDRNSPKLLVEVAKENEFEFENFLDAMNYQYHIIPESIGADLKYYYCWKELHA